MDRDTTYYLVFPFTGQCLINGDGHCPQPTNLFPSTHRSKQERTPQMSGSHVINLLPFLSFLLSLSSLSPSTHRAYHLLSILVPWSGLLTLLAVKDLAFSTFRWLGWGSTYYNLLFTHLLLSVLFANPIQWLLHSETGALSLQVWLGILKTVTSLVTPRLSSTFPPINKIFYNSSSKILSYCSYFCVSSIVCFILWSLEFSRVLNA